MSDINLKVCGLPKFDSEESKLLRNFRATCHDLSRQISVLSKQYSFSEVAKSSRVNIDLYNKYVNNKYPDLYIAMWIIFLEAIEMNIGSDFYKYKSKVDFVEKYKDFEKLESREVSHLFQIANWMNILFLKVKPSRHKGIALEVIPKIVEGFSVRYVTGSGASLATLRRSFIFETEGKLKPVRRNKAKRVSFADDDDIEDDAIVIVPVKKQKVDEKVKVVVDDAASPTSVNSMCVSTSFCFDDFDLIDVVDMINDDVLNM